MISHTHRSILTASVLAITVAMLGCGDSNVEKVDVKKGAAVAKAGENAPPVETMSPHSGTGATATSAAGISWSIPSSWKVGGERPMRVASFVIGPTGKEADCAVFYFGPGQGGAVDANVDRWIGQFSQPDGSDSHKAAKIDHHTISGLNVTTIDLSGVYLASMGGPMSGKSEPLPGYHLMGAIIEAPEGPVFFKLTGPEETVVQALDDFQKLVESVKKS